MQKFKFNLPNWLHTGMSYQITTCEIKYSEKQWKWKMYQIHENFQSTSVKVTYLINFPEHKSLKKVGSKNWQSTIFMYTELIHCYHRKILYTK